MLRKTISVIALSGLTLLVGCGGGSSSVESNESSNTTVPQSAADEPTWVVNSPGDAFAGPAAQTVCNLLRIWFPPNKTSPEQVAELTEATDFLRSMVGSPTDNLYAESYVALLGLSEAQLSNEQNYPTNDYYAFTYDYVETTCNNLGLTEENSEFGITD